MAVYLLESKNSSPLYLYHATDRKHLDSILEKGLLIHPPFHNWDDIYCDGWVFLAFDASVAEDYAYAMDEAPEDVVVVKVKLEDLNPQYVGYDWNNRCEYTNEINSCTYSADIPGHLLQECDVSSEPFQEFSDFEGTELYDIVFNVFWDECETNMERGDE